MADPFSITGSAVGVISLGLTICQGLLAYYGPYKSFHEEINEATSRVQSLDSILTNLHNVISTAPSFNANPPSRSVQAAIQSIQSCKSGLQSLETMLRKCRITRPVGKQSRPANQLNRLLYPFKRETLVKLMATVTWLQANVNTSLLLLQIAILNSSTARMDFFIASLSPKALDTSERKTIAQRINQRQSHMDDTISILQTRLDLIESHIRNDMDRRRLSPDCSRQLMNDQEENVQHMRALIRDTSPLTRNRRKFTDIQTRKVLSLILRHSVCNRFLRLTMIASLTITNGPSGCSISPSLHFRAIVSEDSPSFKLLRSTQLRLNQPQFNPSIIRDTHAGLFELFAEGRASPFDTLGNGITILHAVSSWAQTYAHWEPRQWADWRRFMQDLLEAGLSPDSLTNSGHTPSDLSAVRCLRFQGKDNSEELSGGIELRTDSISFEYYLSSLSANLPESRELHSLFPFVWSVVEMNRFQYIRTQIEQLEPMIWRSTDQLEILLERGMDFQRWLYLYVAWPTGVEILLRKGCQPDILALEQACNGGYEESMRLIIHCRSFKLGQEALEIASSTNNPRHSMIIVEALADRRRKLQRMVEENLPPVAMVELKIRPDALLDRQASYACELLLADSIDISYLVAETGYSVYDTENLSTQTAEQLWNAGFTNVDEGDRSGYTSLMKLKGMARGYSWQTSDTLLKKVAWLVDRGADLYRTPRASHSPAIFFVSHAVGTTIRPQSCWDDTCTVLLHRLLLDGAHDDCSCPCSINGCCALTKLLDGMFQRCLASCAIFDDDEHIQIGYNSLWKMLGQFHHITAARSSLSCTFAEAVIRYITFIELGLTHTCHKQLWGSERFLDSEAIAEIREEERDIIWDLENFVDEFTQGYSVYRYSLEKYIKDVLWPRIHAFRRDKMTEEELNKLQEIGVIIHEPEVEVASD
ncbi:hypothetical protein BJX64DRAFT_271949 [Aspergillus heterothallicus]